MYPVHSYSRRRRCSKERERNLISSVLSMLVVAVLSTAVAQPRWFSMRGGTCPRSYLGVEQFFNIGVPDDEDQQTSKIYGNSDSRYGLEKCVTSHIVLMMRLVIGFCFLAIMSSLFAFVLDTVGVTQRTLKVLRRNAFGSVLTVFFCVAVIGLSYYITTLIEMREDSDTSENRVQVKFDISFYLVTGAGSLAVVATASNLLRKPSLPTEESTDSLLEEYDGLETFSVGLSSPVDGSPLHPMPPPPYTP